MQHVLLLCNHHFNVGLCSRFDMKKIKYYYNTNTLRYEKLVTPLHVKLLRVMGFLASSFVTALIIVSIAFKYLDSPKEKLLREQYESMREKYSLMNGHLAKLQQQMTDLEKRDNEVYRAIFEANPIPDSARAKAMEKQKEILMVQRMGTDDLSVSIASGINNLSKRLAFQDKSFTEIMGFIKNKEVLLASTPAIQPVSNKDLNRIASGFGYRIDPVYKTVKMHAGLDFAAPQGTPIYATANGTVVVAGNLGNGYGNHVIINHGYGYETLYGHMYRVKARNRQKVKRGEIIGYVGSTGKSTGPHLHYEVHKNERPLDPVYFFYNDLTPEQFDRILKAAAASNQSFD
jgi:murein DD-endopeptidase MepM/ murein hydrolase activator NlpD